MITVPRAYAEQRPVLAVGVATVSLAVLGAVAVTVSPRQFLVLLLFGAAAGICATVLANWRMGVYLFLAWLLVEDLPRKFLGNDMRLYFVKDALAVIVYLAFLVAWIQGREPRPRVGFFALLLVFVGWGLVQVFNPRSPSLIYGLLGLRMYFFYLPLLFVGYALLRGERDLRHFLAFNLVLAAVIGGLGIVQGIVGLDFLNPAELPPELNLARLVRQAPITGALVPQPDSIFVSEGRFAWYMLVMFLLGVGARWAWYYATVAPWSPESHLAWRVWGYPIGNLLGAFTFPGWPLGYGIGTSSLGGQYVTGLLGLPAVDIGVESGYGTLILELGIVGPLLWLLWSVALVREGWRTVRQLRGTPLFPMGFAILWFLVLLLFPFTFGGMQPYQNYVFNAYLWLLAGVLFRLPTMARPSEEP